jgi:hypothetical protein
VQICLLLLATVNVAGAAKHALLVGVADYYIKPLSGPVNDVTEMQKVLTERWGFKNKNINILLNEQGTKKNILAAINKLYDQTNPGDQVFIYLSGHGTSASDRDLHTPLPTTSGAFIPIDIKGVKTMEQLVKKLVVGKNDLRPILTKLDEGQRHVFVAIDACYSGNTVRGVFGKHRLKKRFLSAYDILPARAFGDELDFSGGGDWSSAESDVGNTYPYKNIYYLSASGEHEPAQDIPPDMVEVFPTIDGQAHGAFSDTLLKALNNDINADIDGDGTVTYAELKKTVRDKMRVRGFDHTPHGLPSLAEDTRHLASRGIFGDAGGEKPTNDKPAEKPDSGSGPAMQSTATPAPAESPAVKPKPVEPTTKPVKTANNKPVTPDAKPPKTANNGKTPQDAPATTNTASEDTTVLPVVIDGQLKQVIRQAGQLKNVNLVSDRGLEVRKDGADVLFISQAGDLIVRLNKPSVNEIIDNIRHQAWIHQLVAGPFRQDFTINLELYGSGKGSTAVEGELVGFALQSSEKAHILLIDIDPHGTINVLYPYEPSELNPVKANQLLAFKDLSRVTPPFGRDYVQAYAFKEINDDFKALRGKSFSLGSPYVRKLERLINSRRIPKARTSMELVTSSAN